MKNILVPMSILGLYCYTILYLSCGYGWVMGDNTGCLKKHPFWYYEPENLKIKTENLNSMGFIEVTFCSKPTPFTRK